MLRKFCENYRPNFILKEKLEEKEGNLGAQYTLIIPLERPYITWLSNNLHESGATQITSLPPKNNKFKPDATG